MASPMRGPARASRAQGPESGGASRPAFLEDALGFHLRQAQEASFAAFARRCGPAAGAPGLRPGFFALLMTVQANPGLSQTALGAAIGRDKSTLTPALGELARRGLLRRDRAEGNRRSYALALTPAGEAALAAMRAHAEAHDRALDRLVGADGRAAFLDTLRRLTAGLDGSDP